MYVLETIDVMRQAGCSVWTDGDGLNWATRLLDADNDLRGNTGGR